MMDSGSKLRLSLNLLGRFQVNLNGSVVDGFSTDKTRALLAYLTVESDRQHRRQALAGLLWPNYPERSARTSLRTALADLRRVIGDHQAEPPYLLISRHTLAVNLDSDIWVDVNVLSRNLNQNKKSHPNLAQLEEAARLYQGEFLYGFSLSDSAPFDEWVLLRRERIKLQMMAALAQLAAGIQQLGDPGKALYYARRWAELDPWQEPAQRELMQLLAVNGFRADALAQYEHLRKILAEELGIVPETATTRLYQDIRNGKLDTPFNIPDRSFVYPPYLPSFENDIIAPTPKRPIFVGREQELKRMHNLLQDTLQGRGHVLFIIGGAGRGKSALLEEFVRQVFSQHPIISAIGFCNAYSGSGDPYLPFRQILEMLTGDVAGPLKAGRITQEQAALLWQNTPAAARAIVEVGPDLVETFLDGSALLERAEAAAGNNPPWLARLSRLVNARAASQNPTNFEQYTLMDQHIRVLERIAQHAPLLLILEDLHWADNGSIELLMHLGKRLDREPILVLGAYRPDEVAASQYTDHHPLEMVVNEITRLHGKTIIDLAMQESTVSQNFVNALLDTEPNRLGEIFRQKLHDLTRGHPLFTVETLRMLQERGLLVQDRRGFWVEGKELAWDQVPARVEAVIRQRVDRLDPLAAEMLAVASVEGEDFFAEVVAKVINEPERQVLHTLSQQLGHKHRLLQDRGDLETNKKTLSRFRFSHYLIQRHIYDSLTPGERRLLHGGVARAIENLFEDDLEQVTIQLAYHYSHAEVNDKAIHYLTLAGHQARQRYDGYQAAGYYSQALSLADKHSEEQFYLLAARASVYDVLAQREAQKLDIVAMQALALSLGNQRLYCDALLAQSDFYLATEIFRALDPALKARAIAQEIGDSVREAHALRRLSWEGRLGADFQTTRLYLEEAASRFKEAGFPGEAAGCLFMLARRLPGSAKHVFDLDAAQQAEVLSRESGDYSLRAVALKNLAIAYSDQGKDGSALPFAEEALEMHRDLGDRREQCNTLDVLGVILSRLGRQEEATARFQRCLEISEEIGFDWGILGAVFGFWNYGYVPTGELEAFLMFIDKRLEHAIAEGRSWLYSFLLWMKTLGLAYLGQYEEVQRISRLEAYQVTEEDLVGQVFVLQIAGSTKAELGYIEEARQDLEKSLLVAEKTSDRYMLTWPLVDLAGLVLIEGTDESMSLGVERAQVATQAARDVREERQLAAALDVNARLHLALGQLDNAYVESSQAVQLLAADPWLPHPEHLFHTHYLALRALNRDHEARGYLQRACERIKLVAEKITDESMRQGWLQNVRRNREILRLWEES